MHRTISRFLLALLLVPTLLPAQDAPALDAALFRGLALRGIGPALMSGRIADIAVHPERQSTWYVAAGSGGVWKTVNAGATWAPIFDGQASYSIGCVTLDPRNPEIVWVGTGENVSGRHVGFGDGVYKSLDGGTSWTRMGLGASEHIAKILVHPEDSRTVWVAAEGPLWSEGGERGVYQTTDGGATWSRVLQISDDTGITDLEIDPANPDVLYAAAYQRRRAVWAFLAGGPESGIWKSTDGGATWRELTRGLPSGPGVSSDVGKIGLAVSPLDPRVVYATIEAQPDQKGFYRSLDRGETWEKRSDYTSGGTGGHYYQEIYASPHKVDRVYQMDVWMHFSDDGGKTFTRIGEQDKHSDNHALAFDPDDPDYLLAGSDGGLYETRDHGKNWTFVPNLPLTQFYKLALDNAEPFYNIYGGTQDNNAQVGPSRTNDTHGIRSSDWINTVRGDGYGGQIDPTDPNTIYSEWQYGGLTRFDRRTGELIDIKPQAAPGDPPERWNWDSPILISPHDAKRLYFGSQRIWRSNDRGDSWQPISGDLTRDENRYTLPIDGRVWSIDALYDNGAMSWYNNTTTITESPLVEGLLYAGSDDGLVHVQDGEDWRRCAAPPGLAERAFVNDLRASPHDADTVYGAFSLHKTGDYTPHLYRSTDRGHTWNSIAGDLPPRHLVWAVVEDPAKPGLLFAATEFGLFFTLDGSAAKVRWIRLEGGVPTIAFRDLEIHPRENDLVGASFGRGFFILDDLSPLRHIDADALRAAALLFPVRDALLYVPWSPLGLAEGANLGANHFRAPNPPFGAVVTYYLRDSLEGAKAKRRAEEAKIREAGGNVPIPDWETLTEEKRAAEPAVLLTVRDADGTVVRRIEAASSAGLHRTAWDLRYPAPDPAQLEPFVAWNPWMRAPFGPLAPPGRYTVELVRREGGELTRLAEPQEVIVKPLHGPGDPAGGADWSRIAAFQQRTAELMRRALGTVEAMQAASKSLRLLDKALLEAPRGTPLLAEVQALDLRLDTLQRRLAGDPTREGYSEPTEPSVLSRVFNLVYGHWDTTQEPTATQQRELELAEQGFAAARDGIETLIEDDLPRLQDAAEQAGAPWTPGRDVP